ncbi:M81 family metallopeptidase [Herbaspirillum sp. LeCh32-8]|uniref:M81 family metallopeptidase n=1 Tax=Herbaspirillum sp. LeCh32-8 TaxID=2821356 RepID=UPI001AE8C94E|nr:M81 family metallopeptidase [Herbaspirillum sp. LeCh32-8]MBP0597526.1 M81 family metallopeptidase [Herbaspirillum sp. LeCh32-8]
MRIAIGGFQHETNTFSPVPTRWENLLAADTWPGLLQGPALLETMASAPEQAPRNIPIAGLIDAAARAASVELLPLAWAAAGPSGRVTREAFERMSTLLLERLAQHRPDAVYLDLHGAMAAEHIDDADGELLQRVRAAIGPEVPLVASLDLHANVSPRMLAQADLLLSYRTYPHVDMAATGARAFDWLLRLLSGQRRPLMAWRRIPFLIPMCWQCTDLEPARALQALTQTLEQQNDAPANFTMGFPAADVAECGPVVWAYGRDAAQAERTVEQLLQATLDAEATFNGEIFDARGAVARALQIVEQGRQQAHRPVVIADAQDNPGAGGSADTTGLLRELVRADANAVIGLLVDPQAAAAAHAAGVGADLALALGGRSGITGDAPLETGARVVTLHDGVVDATGSVFRGYRLTLGPSALLAIGRVNVIVVSQPVQLLDLALLRFVGLTPEELDIIAVKSTVHFRADFAPIAADILVCAAPGAFALDPAQLPWTRLPAQIRRRPLG